MTIKEEIRWRKACVRENAKLGAAYARDKDYREAARWYHAADFHKEVLESLSAHAKLNQ